MSQPREDYAKEAYHDGKEAARKGVLTNPHPWGSHLHVAWGLGYECEQDIKVQRRLNRALEGT